MPERPASSGLWERIARVLLSLAAYVLAALWAVPILWAIVVSIRPASVPLAPGNVWFAFPLTIENYLRAWSLSPFDRYYLNTIIIVAMVLAVQLTTITLAGYAFAAYHFPGKRILFFFILLQLMIPSVALLVPNFSTIRALGLFNTRLAVAIPYFGSAFGTFLMRQAFLEVPRDLVDAGVMDGASWYQLLRHIYLPPATATLVAFTISSLSFHWNDFLWPLVVTNSDLTRPLTIGLVRFTQMGEIGAQWSLLTAATITVIAPLLILFLIFQRGFIQSFLHTGIK